MESTVYGMVWTLGSFQEVSAFKFLVHGVQQSRERGAMVALGMLPAF